MGFLRGPGPGQKPPRAASPPREDEATNAAELVIVLFPAGATPAAATGSKDVTDSGKPATRLMGLVRRIGLQLRLSVPPTDAAEMLRAVQHVGIILAWAVTVLGTLAITVPAGMSARTIITVIALELAGFTVGAFAMRRRRKES